MSKTDFSKIPDNFPRLSSASSLPGESVKLSAVMYEGKFYAPDDTPPERLERWIACEDMAQQIAEGCIETKKGKRAHMSKEDILEQYYDRFLLTGWVTNDEGRWVLIRSANIIQWPLPLKLQDAVDN